MNEIIKEVHIEVERQIKLWGIEFDGKNTPNDWVAYIVKYAADAAYDGRHQKYSSEEFRLNMKKVAAIAISAMITHDHLSGELAKRHYDQL